MIDLPLSNLAHCSEGSSISALPISRIVSFVRLVLRLLD